MNSFVPHTDPAILVDFLLREGALQSIADNVPVLIARVDCERRYLFANRAYQDLLGLPREQVVGRTMPEVLGAAAYEIVRPYVDRVLAGESVTFEARLDYATVGPRWMHGSYVPEVDPGSGAVTGFLLSSMDVTARRAAEDANRWLAMMVENSHDALIGTDLDGRIVSWNRGAERIYGYTAEEIVGRSVSVFYPPEETGDYLEYQKALMRSGEVQHFEADRMRKDGTRRRMTITVSPVRDSAGRVTGCASIVRDITTQTEAQEAANRLARIVESSHDAIFSTDLDGAILTWNGGAERLYGYTSAEVVGRSVALFYPPEDLPFLRVRLDALQQGEYIPEYGAVRVCKDGTRKIVSVTISPLRDSRGEITSIASIVRDITAQKKAEEKAQFLSQIVEHSQDAIVSSDPDGLISSWNRGAERLYGYTAAEAIGNSVALIHPPEDLPILQERLEALGRGETVPEYEAVRVAKDGTPRRVSVTISLVRDTEGRIVSHSAISRDITAQKEAQEATGRLALLVESSHDAIISTTLDGLILTWNKGAERLFGYPAAEAVGQPMGFLRPPESPELLEARMDILRRDESVPEYQAVRFGKNGVVREVSVTLSPIRDRHGTVTSFAAIMRDITAQKIAEREQKEAERERRRLADSLRLLLDSSGEGIFGLDRAGNFTFLNPAACRMFGGEPAQMLGKHAHSLVCHTYADGRPYPVEECPLFQAISAGRECRIDEEAFWRFDGTWFPAHYCAAPLFEDGQVQGCVVTFADISERKAWETERERRLAEATERADRDPLTGLLNHRAFHERLEAETERCRREGTFLAVAMLDLGHFKFFNDAYGHLVGDDALRRVAEALRGSCRAYDVPARFGGDEFAVLMPGVGRAEVAAAADRLAERLVGLSLRPPGSPVDVPLELTMGVALFPEDGGTPLEAVALADKRLYAAKSGAGRPRPDEPLRAHLTRTVEGFAMLDTLVTAVDAKDRYTRRHADGVLQAALQIAGTLGLDDSARHTLSLAALLQEVGRIGIPDRILRKPGPLSEPEWESVRQHPALSALLVGTVPGLIEIVEAVRHHHERWDGGGYPLGLAGDAIPFLARLLAVADAYAALTSDRPYRHAFPDREARAILAAGASRHWDPACITAFLGA